MSNSDLSNDWWQMMIYVLYTWNAEFSNHEVFRIAFVVITDWDYNSVAWNCSWLFMIADVQACSVSQMIRSNVFVCLYLPLRRIQSGISNLLVNVWHCSSQPRMNNFLKVVSVNKSCIIFFWSWQGNWILVKWIVMLYACALPQRGFQAHVYFDNGLS